MKDIKNLLEIIEYNSEDYKEYYIEDENISDIESLAHIPEGYVRWINIDEEIGQDMLDRINKT